MDLNKLWEVTKQVFLDEKIFQMKKVITDITSEDGKFLGDFFSYLIREERKDESPTFYSIISPYDALWKTEAYSANIYKDGKIIYNGDFKEYTWIRTGLLTPLIIHTLEIDLTKKKILIVGSWKLAKNAVKALIVLNPNITEIFYTSFSWRKKEFEENFQKELFQLTYKEVPIYNDYDFIGLYTNTSTPILSSISQIKENAIVASHISSTDYAEYSDDIYKEANVIIDWQENISNMKDLGRALEKWYLSQENILSFKDILNKKSFSLQRKYLLIRSTGTPMQNVAVLKYLTQEI